MIITGRVKGKARQKRINVTEKKTSQTEQSMFLITACKAGQAKHTVAAGDSCKII